MMKQEDTKQRILDKALELFSARGYDSVSVGEIAEAVGIRAPSLYNHFPGKQAIFDAIVESTAAQYEADTGRLDIHVQSASRDIPVFAEITEDALYEKVRQIFSYSLHNEQISRFRRMMTIEQFRSPELAALYSGRYVDRVLAYHRRDRGGGPGHAGHAVCGPGADPDRHLRPPAGAGGRVPGKAAAACDALFPVGPWRKQPGDIGMESQTLRRGRRVWFSIGRAFDIPGAMCYNLVTSIY